MATLSILTKRSSYHKNASTRAFCVTGDIARRKLCPLWNPPPKKKKVKKITHSKRGMHPIRFAKGGAPLIFFSWDPCHTATLDIPLKAHGVKFGENGEPV